MCVSSIRILLREPLIFEVSHCKSLRTSNEKKVHLDECFLLHKLAPKIQDFSNQIMFCDTLEKLQILMFFFVKSNITISDHFCDDEVPL